LNIAFFLTPKNMVAYLYDDYTLEQCLRKMRNLGYSAIPVITREGQFAGTVSEGDLLWYLVEDGVQKTYDVEKPEVRIRDIVCRNTNPPVRITAAVEELLDRAMNQNFVPVVDDNGSFVGIITRRDIIKYFCDVNGMLPRERAGGPTAAPQREE